MKILLKGYFSYSKHCYFLININNILCPCVFAQMPLHSSKLSICLSWDPFFISVSLKDSLGIIDSKEGLKWSYCSETTSGSAWPSWDVASRLAPKHTCKIAHLLPWTILLRPSVLSDSPCPKGNDTYPVSQRRAWHSFQLNFLVAEPCSHYHILDGILKKAGSASDNDATINTLCFPNWTPTLFSSF